MLTFKESENIIKKYAKEYKKSKIIEIRGLDLLDDLIKDPDLSYGDSENKYRYYYSLQTKIDWVLDKLDNECSSFIRMEFFTSSYRQDWWMSFYSRSTYYRLKKKSMEKFLGLLYA